MQSRRTLIATFLAAAAIRPASASAAVASGPAPVLGGEPLPDLSPLWASLPLPFTPSEAWQSLPAAVQAEIGAAVIGMALANYIAGDGLAEADQFHCRKLRAETADAADAILNAMDARLWGLFPTLYGPDGDHPRWALDGGLAS